MRGLIDTNILIYAVSESAREYPKARAFLERSLAGPEVYGITWINIGEFLSFVTQPFFGAPPLLAPPDALNNLNLLLGSSRLTILAEGDSYWECLKEVLGEVGTAKGAFVHDCRIAAIMRENGVDTIFTRDTDFRKIPRLKVVDPLE